MRAFNTRPMLLPFAILIMASPTLAAEETVAFAAGSDTATVQGELASEASERYLLGASEGQFLTVSLSAESQFTYFTVYTPAGDILYESTQGGNEFYGQLPESGDTAVAVIYKGEPSTTVRYDITFTINAGTIGKTTPQATVGGVDPSDVTIVACLAAVGEQTGNDELSFLSKEFSEANSAVMIGVGADQAPWRCLVSNDGVVAEVMFTGDEGAL